MMTGNKPLLAQRSAINRVNALFDSVILRAVGRACCPGIHLVKISLPLPSFENPCSQSVRIRHHTWEKSSFFKSLCLIHTSRFPASEKQLL